jgi:ketosteroid isomerase-like protein
LYVTKEVITVSRERNIKNARNVLKFLEQRKFNEYSELFAENGKWIHPYHSGLFPAEIVGQKDITNWIKNTAANFDNIQFPIDEVMPFLDPNKVAVKNKGKLKLRNSDNYYENDYLAIFSFDEQGKIVEWIEYYNPVIAAKAFGLMDKLK